MAPSLTANDGLDETRPSGIQGFQADVRLIVLVFLLSRVFQALFVYVGHLSHPFLEQIEGGYAGVPSWWLNPWTTYDSEHFLAIGNRGYVPATAAFFPLYPLLLKLGGSNIVNQALAGVLISNAAFLGGLWFLHKLTRLDFGEDVARRAIWLVAFFPTAATFSAVYTESVFFFLVTATFLSLRYDSKAGSATGAFLAASCRNSGLVLCLTFWTMAYRRYRAGRNAVPAALAGLGALLAFVVVQGYFTLRFGSGSGLAAQKAFDREFSIPFMPLVKDAFWILSGQMVNPVIVLNLIASVLALVIAVWLWRRDMKPYAVFLGGVMLMQLSFARTFPPYTVSSVRYAMTTFPFVQVLAYWTLPWTKRPMTGVLLAIIYGLLNALFSYMWGLKSFSG